MHRGTQAGTLAPPRHFDEEQEIVRIPFVNRLWGLSAFSRDGWLVFFPGDTFDLVVYDIAAKAPRFRPRGAD